MRYLRIEFNELLDSPGWKKRTDAEKGAALLSLLASAPSGSVPACWKRVAAVRTVGEPAKVEKKPRSGIYDPFYAVWEEAWERRKPESFVWDGRQRGAIKTCYARTQGDVEKWRRRVERLFELGEWYAAKATPAFAVSRWNELVGNGAPAAAPTPKVDEATRRMREMWNQPKADPAPLRKWLEQHGG